jgi:hypothetical protein
MRSERQPVAAPPAPSAKTLAVASALAVLAATVVLVTAVLPAEYGIDPLGTGRRLGFLALSQADHPAPVPPPQGTVLAPVREGQIDLYPGEFKVDSRQFVLGPYEYVEFKYQMAKDAVMLFSWSADGDVQQDFHGDREGAAADAAQSYDKQPRRKSDGSFTAPFPGIHGWYWENPGGATVTVTVRTAGFYSAAHQFTMRGTREPRRVSGPETIPVTDK